MVDWSVMQRSMMKSCMCLMPVHLVMFLVYSMMGSMIKNSMTDMMCRSRNSHMMACMRHRSREMMWGWWWRRVWRHHMYMSIAVNMDGLIQWWEERKMRGSWRWEL